MRFDLNLFWFPDHMWDLTLIFSDFQTTCEIWPYLISRSHVRFDLNLFWFQDLSFSDFQIPCEVCPTFFLISRPHVRFYLIFSDFQITHKTCPFSDLQIPCEVFALILFWFPDQMWELLVRSATRAFGRVSAAVQKRNNSRNNNSPPRHWLPRPGYWI